MESSLQHQNIQAARDSNLSLNVALCQTSQNQPLVILLLSIIKHLWVILVNLSEYLYRPNGVARRAAWEEPNADTNSCVEGSVIGGLLGAGLGAALSRGNGRWFGVPVGGAAGALIGCQVDGG